MKIPKIVNSIYILRKKISSGSFGIVFQGITKDSQELIAIKLEK